MSTNTPFQPPRKKPSAIWWVIGAFFLILLVFFLQLFSTSSRIDVSRQTTYITAPLGAGGLPDYEAYIRDHSRRGVTPQNNAAAVIWPMVWPGELSPQNCAPVAAELGIDAFPPASATLQPVWKALQSNASSEQAANDALEIVTTRPWKSAQNPGIVKWANQYQQQLDTLVAGSKLPRCYYPSPSYIDNQRGTLYDGFLPGPQSSREVGRSLCARAMGHAGEGRIDDAWQDLLATLRTGRLIAQGPTLVEKYIGMAVSNMGCVGTVAMLGECHPSAEEARRILIDLQALPAFPSIVDSIDEMERIMFLDFVIAVSRGQIDTQLAEEMGIDQPSQYLHRVRIDWNAVLRKSNEIYDRVAAAAKLPDRAARQEALAQIEDDISKLGRSFTTSSLLAAATNPTVRNEMVAGQLLAGKLQFLENAFDINDRVATTAILTQYAAALALFRAEHSEYPEQLTELAPSIFATLPTGPYGPGTLIYKRIGSGYLLYSTGPNARDDNGSNGQQQIFQGIPVAQLDDTQAEALKANPIHECDDIAIRTPLPVLESKQP